MKERISTLLRPLISGYRQKIKPYSQTISTTLPRYHRWGIGIALGVVVVGILLPSAPPPQDVTLRHVDPPPSISESATSPEANQHDPQGRWHSYHVAAGETLAQLFRDNNLPTEAIFAMANVEGEGKPLSTLSAGQLVKIRLTPQGKVTGLTLDSTQGSVLFIRQEDGSFIRAQ